MSPAQPKQKRAFNLRVKYKQKPDVKGPTISTSTESASKSRSQNWRLKLQQTNPCRYQKILDDGKHYSQYYRLKCALAASDLQKRTLSLEEREEAKKWHQRKLRMNETARKRMQRMKERRKKLEQASSAQKKKTVCLTRQQHDKVKEKERIRKQQQRAMQTAQQKTAILAKRREKYRQSKMDIKERIMQKEKDDLKREEERLKKLEEEMAQQKLQLEKNKQALECENAILEDAIDLRTDMAKAKALERVRKALPRKRAHSVATTLEIISKASPIKARAFKAVSTSPSALEDAVIEVVANELQQQKKSVTRKNLACSLSSLKGLKLQRALSRKFKVSRNLLRNAVKRSAGRRAIPASTITLIQDFYETSSNPLPDKKFVSKKTFKPRHIMDKSIAQLHKEYNAAHPNHTVSATVFYRYRPRNVKHKAQAKVFNCLCEYCENIQLKLDCIKHFQKFPIFKNGYEVVNSTLCPKEPNAKYHKPLCINRGCPNCGVNMLDEKFAPALLAPEKTVQWKAWEMVTTECHTKSGTKCVKKRSLVTRSGPISRMLQELKTEIIPFAEHLFNKDWQHQQQISLQKKLRADEVLGIYDFAENYKCSFQREVQSAYYSQESVTVHPIVSYYLCNKCHAPVTESCVMISDDLTHDHHLVNAFQQVITQHLKSKRSLPLSTFYRFSDGCCSQYKSRGPIADISFAGIDYGVVLHHNYSGTRHGKGASDGESGVLKKHASEAVKSGTAVISDAKSLFQYLSSNLTRESAEGKCCSPFRRTVFYIPCTSVNRNRQERTIKTIQGTRKLHSIKTKKAGRVLVRNLSCFCDGCLRGKGKCENELYVNQWKEVKLLHTNQTGSSNNQGQISIDAVVGPDDVGKPDDDGEPHNTGETDKVREADAARDPDDAVKADTDSAGEVEEINSKGENINVEMTGHLTTMSEAEKSHLTASNTVHLAVQPTAANSDVPQHTINSDEVRINMYVAVKLSGPGKRVNQMFVYMAMVTRMDSRHVQLKFMKKTKDGYVFTNECEALHPMKDIISMLQDPEMINIGRSYVYKFVDEEIHKLSQKYSLK